MPVRNLWSLEPGECIVAEEILNQIHTYLDFAEMKAQLFTNIEPENYEQG